MNDGAPVAAPAAPAAQLPPSSFDAAMASMNNARPATPEPAGAGSALKIPTQSEVSSKVEKPLLDHAQPLGEPDPNDPAELAAKAELERTQGENNDLQPGEQPEVPPDMAQAYHEWKEWNDSLVLPEKLMDKTITVPWGDKGKTRDVPISEMKAGYMRQLDATRKNQASADTMRQAQAMNQNVARLMQDLTQPQSMRTVLEDLGYGPVLRKVAESIYAEELQDEKVFYDLRRKGASDEHLNMLRERLNAERNAKLEKRAWERQRQQWEMEKQQQMQQRQQEQDGSQLKNQLDQLRPLAFKRLGMPDDAVHNNAFIQVFTSILQTGGAAGRELRDVVLDAANGAKQLVEENISAVQAQAEEEARRARTGAPLSPQRLPGAPPRAGSGVSPAGQRRLSPADFDREMARMDGGRG